MTENYHYQVDEKSLTQNFLNKFLWTPIVQRIPASITPNSITVCGAIFMMLSMVFVWQAVIGRYWAYLLVSLCIFLYTTGDNVDGPHARHTGQSSKLGEFLDHWLDAINMIVVNMGIILSLAFNDWPLVILATSAALAFYATIWEHYHTGVFHSGRLGTNEGLLLIIALYIFLFFLPTSDWIRYKSPMDITLASVMMYFSTAVCLITLVKTLVRMKQSFSEYIPLVLLIISIYCLAISGMDKRLAALGILTSNLIFSGPFLIKRLTNRSSSFRPWIVCIIALALIGITLAIPAHLASWIKNMYFFYPAAVLLLIVAGWDLWRAVYFLKLAKNKLQ